MQAATQNKTRYTAEWIVKQHFDASGEWQPDRDERMFSYHTTLAAAQAEAIKQAKAAGVADWCRVSEERKTRYHWDEVSAWVGDWDACWNQIR